MVAAAQELERQKAELQARRQLEFQRQRTKSLEVAAQRRQQEEEVNTLLRRFWYLSCLFYQTINLESIVYLSKLVE